MVKINGKKLKIYDLDNLITIKDRIALNLKTLPKEFAITELRKKIQNNIESFSTFTELKTNVYP